MKKEYYVYVWLRADLYSPYYVGKGKGRRDTDKTSRRGVKPPTDRNRVRRVKEGMLEEDALSLEKKLIEFYGRKVDGGILNNISLGGRANSGFHHTPKACAAIGKACMVYGKRYSTAAEAARELGVTRNAVGQSCRRKSNTEFYYVDVL